MSLNNIIYYVKKCHCYVGTYMYTTAESLHIICKQLFV